MRSDQLDDIRTNEVLRKRMAKWMAQFCFRDTKLEDLHDRISDDEMKELMIDCVNHCYAFLSILFFNSPRADGLIDTLKEHDPAPKWDEPEMPPELLKRVRQLQKMGILP
jgi:hypothetical protein